MNHIVRKHTEGEPLEANEDNTPFNIAPEFGPRWNRFSLLAWLVAAIFIFALLYSSSYLALLWLPPYEGLNMKSQLTADYGAWASLVFQPIDSAILQDIQQEEGLPDEIITDGSSWPTPVTAESVPTSLPQATLNHSPSIPTGPELSFTATPMPTSMISPQASIVTLETAQTSVPASAPYPTKTPKFHKTPKPSKTPKTPKP